ncbi:MAG: hypothetical protein AB9903_17765 [Vulcanimicrobiota bacterium]
MNLGRHFAEPVIGLGGTVYTWSGNKKIYALRDLEFSEKIERMTRVGSSSSQQNSAEVVQEGDWLIVGDVKIPVCQKRHED